jgi:hypothetical protein
MGIVSGRQAGSSDWHGTKGQARGISQARADTGGGLAWPGTDAGVRDSRRGGASAQRIRGGSHRPIDSQANRSAMSSLTAARVTAASVAMPGQSLRSALQPALGAFRHARAVADQNWQLMAVQPVRPRPGTACIGPRNGPGMGNPALRDFGGKPQARCLRECCSAWRHAASGFRPPRRAPP